MAVEGGGLDRGMAHELLDRGHANAQLILPCRERAPTCVAARVDARRTIDRLDPRGQRDRAHMLSGARAGDQWRCVRPFR